ncbi:adenylyltransferase/cytidyltransferase family protein [Crocinitomicaceae bacterium CZZ-1]|uniref:Adenylyltransferase/cytidyltransferase family protein n=2 Tax=Taishania pollutisoli TaxID=2766479 RepID=A0A8J6PB62_9FLAO|nr:adenylyltransferase/cytidyltransferase family protein [Taishania pollutisoli]MBX2950018.1 adenylyltransferase/cytidyltransferase family protein [Crocinitomicaceae bacterium]NGF74937.1 adenylyltransferase/cytidyltransferase family protein [Fluviicola sp. SGL-29]
MTRQENLQNKIVTLEEAIRRVGIWRNTGMKITFTNGCFDILHTGHVTYLTQAADLANRLIVGLNSDASVKRQGKADNRPINSEASRAIVLAGLSAVDLVVIFDENTPYELIKTLQPDIVAKGSDYDADERNTDSKTYIVGADLMDATGGKVVSIPLVEGFSTTNLIQKIKQ